MVDNKLYEEHIAKIDTDKEYTIIEVFRGEFIPFVEGRQRVYNYVIEIPEWQTKRMPVKETTAFKIKPIHKITPWSKIGKYYIKGGEIIKFLQFNLED